MKSQRRKKKKKNWESSLDEITKELDEYTKQKEELTTKITGHRDNTENKRG